MHPESELVAKVFDNLCICLQHGEAHLRLVWRDVAHGMFLHRVSESSLN